MRKLFILVSLILNAYLINFNDIFIQVQMLHIFKKSFIHVQWGDNQNDVFEFALKEISHLPNLTTSRGLKNLTLPRLFLTKSLLS